MTPIEQAIKNCITNILNRPPKYHSSKSDIYEFPYLSTYAVYMYLRDNMGFNPIKDDKKELALLTPEGKKCYVDEIIWTTKLVVTNNE